MIGWKGIFALFLAFQLYLLFGMLVFHFLEMENEETVRRDTREYKQKILANFTCLDDQSLENLILAITYAINNGVDPSNNSTSRSNWEYNNAYFFSGTIITTIGYGHISPSTRGGQSFCIIYALIGIPLCGIFLSSLGDKLCKLKDGVLERAKKKIKKSWQQKVLKVFITLVVGMAAFILIPAFIFTAVEGWNYHEAWYYCFITLTTVGFGDFVVGQNADINYPVIYKIMCTYWIMLGLVYLAIVIQDISNAISSKVERFEEQVQAREGLKGFDENDECVEDVTDGHEVDEENNDNGKLQVLEDKVTHCSNPVEVALVDENNESRS